MEMHTYHYDIIEMWKNKKSQDFGYFDKVENVTARFWDEGTTFKTLFDRLDTTELLEIACGQGRHTALIPRGYRRIFALDTSVDAVEIAVKRFEAVSEITVCLSTDGKTIPQPDDCFTAAFSYDAMVHFEPLTMAGYLSETARVLKSGAYALFHHSYYDKNPTGEFTQSPHWRNYMTEDLLAHLASRAGLKVVETHAFPWSGEDITDGLSLLVKP